VFVTFDRGVRVSLCVVTLGTPDRLWRCLDALRAHASRHEFTVTVVVNAATPDGAPPEVELPPDVEIDVASMNLGWAGGPHRARARTDAELLVWVQDDMTPEPGWLDSLVDAADAHPQVGAFGSVRVDEQGEVLLSNAGAAQPRTTSPTGTTPTARPSSCRPR
jgi:GT2 family glycosyltransferase